MTDPKIEAKMIEERKKKAETMTELIDALKKRDCENPSDGGHIALMADVLSLMVDTLTSNFHDFYAEDATPKILLVSRLEEIITNVKNGKYDN